MSLENTGNAGEQVSENAPEAVESQTSLDPQAAPTATELSDDALVTWKGAKEPVKFSNLRGLQSQFTKVSQAKAKLEQQYRTASERNKQLEDAISRAASHQQSQRQGQPTDPFEKIRQLPYLTGQEAADSISAITNELGRRDQILQLMAQKIAQLDAGYSSLNRNHGTQSFEKKLSGWVNELGLDPEFVEDARVFYLAHDWDDDSEFPELYQKHLEKRSAIEQRRRTKEREEAKRRPFVPGKGGLSAANREATFAGKSAKEQADELWPLISGAAGT